MNLFRFLNVGQGLFYSGRINVNYSSYCYNITPQGNIMNKSQFRFVFDCGSTSAGHETYLENAIKNDFFKGETIDLVFISHLHDDHFNGIEILNNYANIENIILPYMSDDCYIEFISYFLSLKDANSNNFDSHLRYFNTLIKKYSSQEYKRNKDYHNEWKKLENYSNYAYDYHFKIIINHEWKFYLINKSIKEETINRIKNDIASKVGGKDLEDVKKYLSLNKNGLNEIKSIYETYIGSKKLNTSSTVVIHHPSNNLGEVTMLTGDAEFDDYMIDLCKKYLGNNSIKYLQIPHHGSFGNWEKMKDLKDSAINLFISYGIGNRYSHPSPSLVKETQFNGRLLFCATQSLSFLSPWNQYLID